MRPLPRPSQLIRGGDRMKRFIEGEDRKQATLLAALRFQLQNDRYRQDGACTIFLGEMVCRNFLAAIRKRFVSKGCG